MHAIREYWLPTLAGVVVSTLLASTLVVAGLKAGITPGVSPLVVLFGWATFQRHLARGGTTVFLNVMQVAGSAGMAVTAGVIFTAPLLPILYRNQGVELPGLDTPTLILSATAGALIGFGYIGLTMRSFLSDMSLPAPEARACDTMIQSAGSRYTAAAPPPLATSLGLGTLAGILAPLLARLGVATDHVVLWSRSSGERSFQLDIPFAPIYIGIGGLLTLGTAVLTFGGAMLRLVGDFSLAGINDASHLATLWPASSMRWVGGGAMAVAVLWSLLRFFVLGRRAQRGNQAPNPQQTTTEHDAEHTFDPELLAIPSTWRAAFLACIVAGASLLIGWVFVSVGWSSWLAVTALAAAVMIALMVPLGALLSLQIGSSASPVSGTVFVTTLVLCLVALAWGRGTQPSDLYLLTGLLVACCVAVVSANDASQDFRTMQLSGVPLHLGFFGQLAGLITGAIAVPIALQIADRAYVLGSPELPAPQGQVFATLVEGLLIVGEIPWTPILVGAALGCAALLLELAGRRRGRTYPAMALAIGIYLPAYLGIGILLGAIARRIAEGAGPQRSTSVLCAAGLITGAAIFDLLFGVGIIAGLSPEGLKVIELPYAVTALLGLVGIAAVLALIAFNSRISTKAQLSPDSSKGSSGSSGGGV